MSGEPRRVLIGFVSGNAARFAEAVRVAAGLAVQGSFPVDFWMGATVLGAVGEAEIEALQELADSGGCLLVASGLVDARALFGTTLDWTEWEGPSAGELRRCLRF